MGNCITPEPEIDFDGPGKTCIVHGNMLCDVYFSGFQPLPHSESHWERGFWQSEF